MSGYTIAVLRGRGIAAPHVMDGFSAALRRLGQRVRDLDSETAPEGTLKQLLGAEAPQTLVIGYGVPLGRHYYDSGGALIGLEQTLGYAALFFDNPFLYFQHVGTAAYQAFKRSPRLLVCCSDQVYVAALRRHGFARCAYLPLATDERCFYPESPGAESRANGQVCFVGSVDEDIAARQQERRRRWQAYPALQAIIEQACALPTLMSIDVARQLTSAARQLPWDIHAVLCRTVYEETVGLIRLRTVAALTGIPVVVYGGGGWRQLSAPHVRYGGAPVYPQQVRQIYAQAAVTLSISSPQLRSGLTQRVFDVSACGGFVLSDYRRDIPRLFAGAVDSYRSGEELRRKLEYYRRHTEARAARAAAAQAIVMRRHTYVQRSRELLDIVGAELVTARAG